MSDDEIHTITPAADAPFSIIAEAAKAAGGRAVVQDEDGSKMTVTIGGEPPDWVDEPLRPFAHQN